MQLSLVQKERTGVMVCIWLDAFTADRITPAKPPAGAEVETRKHITLAYIGDKADVEPKIDKLIECVECCAECTAPFAVTLDGVAKFANDVDAVYAKVLQNADLDRLHSKLCDMLAAADFEVARVEDPYVPHATLFYAEPGYDVSQIEVPRLEMSVSSIAVAYGDNNWQFLLEGKEEHEEEEQKPMSMPMMGEMKGDSHLAIDYAIEAAMEILRKAMADRITKAAEPYSIWMGVSHNSFVDRNGARTITPRAAILEDILFQNFAIKMGLPRPAWQHGFNGPTYEDYGALVLDHKLDQPVGRTYMRLLLKDSKSCIEIGTCAPGSTGSRSTMSVGFIPTWNEDRTIKSMMLFERSPLMAGREASPHTFFKMQPKALHDDGAMRAILAILGREFPVAL